MKRLFLLPAIFSLNALAYSPNQCPPEKVCPEVPAKVEIKDSAYFREKSFGTVMGGFQLINTWVPKKVTGSYTQILNRDFSLELEYATSQKDVTVSGTKLERLQEERFTLFVKYYLTSSFHISAGPYQNNISAKVDGFDNKFDMQVFGISAGIGNRWQLKNGITLGIDWFRINQPTRAAVNERIRDTVNDNSRRPERIIRTIPSLTYFGVNIGYSF